MNKKQILILVLVIAIAFISSSQSTFGANYVSEEELNRQHKPIPAPDTSIPKVIQIDKYTFKVGKAVLNTKDRSIKIEGKINMSDGLVEYLACSPFGKLHESVLSCDVNPYHIQMALLLLSIAPGDHPIEFQGAKEKPCGSPVSMSVSWQENGKMVHYPPERLLVNIKDKKNMEKTNWVFTGSKIIEGQHMAQIEGSIVAIFHDPFAIIDHTSNTGSDDTLYFANKKVLPKVGTAVTLTIFPVTDPAIKNQTKCNH